MGGLQKEISWLIVVQKLTDTHKDAPTINTSSERQSADSSEALAASVLAKRAGRRKMANLSPAQKLRVMEQLRERKEFQKGTRRSLSPEVRFGGRATASGVNYEVSIAALLAVK